MSKIACSLTIAGTDPTGGAGIQADLKTFQELQSYGMSVITSVVAQNTTGVQDIHHLPLSMIDEQLQSVFSDMPVHAMKTGDRKSTRLNSSHVTTSYAVFCLKK